MDSGVQQALLCAGDSARTTLTLHEAHIPGLPFTGREMAALIELAKRCYQTSELMPEKILNPRSVVPFVRTTQNPRLQIPPSAE